MPIKKRIQSNPMISRIRKAKKKLLEAEIFLGKGTPEYAMALRSLREQSTGEAKAFFWHELQKHHNPKKEKPQTQNTKTTAREEKIKVGIRNPRYPNVSWFEMEKTARFFEKKGKIKEAIRMYYMAAD